MTGLEIDGTAVSAAAGQTVPVEGWGQLTLGAKVGRFTAPLLLRLVQARDSLPAGTSILVAFAGTARLVESRAKRDAPRAAHSTRRHAAKAHERTKPAPTEKKHRRLQPTKPPPDFPASPDPLLARGVLAPTALANPVVSIAAQYLGIPYRWGGARPKTGFDCSGLVTYVFAHLGVSLPHYAAAQWYSPDAVWVPPDRLQAGDLVFFTGSDGTRKMPGHVGIYVGDGYLIDAPHTGTFVRIDSLDERWFANKYVGAKRITASLSGGASRVSAAPPSIGPDFLGVSGIPTSVDGVARFRGRIPLVPAGEVTAVAAEGSVALRHASTGYAVWTGAGLGGLLLALGTGWFFFRRRDSARVAATPDSMN